MAITSQHCQDILKDLRTVPTIVIAHTFCASPDTPRIKATGLDKIPAKILEF